MAANGIYYSLNQGLLLSTNEITRVDISTGGTVTFNSAYSFPNSDGTNTQVLQTDGNGSLSFGQVQNSALQNSSLTVTAGDGLTGGGSITLGGSATVNVDYAGADNVILAATNQTSTQVTTGSKIMVSDASNDVNYHNVSDLPFTNNAGTVTSVGITAGALVDVSNSPITTSGNITVAVDLSELTTTSDDANADFIPVINSSNQQFKIAPANVALSLFDNDEGWTSNVGTVTSVAVTGTDGIDVDSGSPITSSGTITLGLSNVPNSSLANSSITFAADSGSNQIMSLGDTFTVEGGGGMLTSTGTDKVVVSHYNAGSAPSNINSNNSNGTVLQDLSLSFDTYGHITGATVGTTNLDNRYFTETEADARFLSFRTINVPNGTDPVADAYNDTLNFTSSDGSVVINGNSSTDTIDFTIGANVDTFVTGGTFSSGSLTLGRNDGSSATAITGFGTVTSVAISGTDGIDVDSGSPITDSGTIELGLSNVPNSVLQNSSLTVGAGAGLTDGGSVSLGGSTTLNIGEGVGITVNANDVAIDYLGDDNFIGSATDLVGTAINANDWLVYHDVTDSNVKRGAVSDLPFTNNSGTVTSVGITAGALIDVSNSPITTSGNINVAVDLSELPTSTTNGDGDFFAVIDSTNVQRKLTKGNINISGFNNDAGYTTNTGTVTSVAISGTDGIDVDSGSPITSSGTITLGLSNVPNSSLQNSSITIAGSVISLGGAISGDNIIADVGAGEILLTQLEEDSITINGTPVTLGGSINVGDITAVTAGNGLTGGGTTGSVTLNVGAGTGILVAADTVSLDYAGTNNFIDSAPNLEGTGIALGDTLVYHDATDNNVKKGFVSDLPFSNNSGTVTEVTVGTGLDVSNGTTTPNITLDLNELPTSTTDSDGDFFVVVDSSGVQRKLTKTSIGNNDFVNNAGYTTNVGTVTSIAISGTDGIDVDSGSPITSSGTITLGLSNVPNSSLANSSITINGSAIALGGSINVGDITAVTAGNGLTGGGTTGSVTLNVGAGTGILVAADTVGLDYAGTNNFIDSAPNLEGTGIATSDTIIYHDATDNNVKKGFVSDLPFSNNSGTVTSVAISGSDGIDVDSGSPITSSGTIALGLSNVPNSSLANSSITIAGSAISLGGAISGDNIIADVGAGEILLTQLEEDSITINGTPVTLGGSINVGDITAVTAGNGLTGGGTTGSVTLTVGAGTLIDVDGTSVNVDLSELTTSTSDADGDFFVVVDSANNQKKLTKGNINNSGFNNDAGYITSAGNTNIYGSNGTLSGARTLSQNGNRLKFDSSSAESFDIVKTTAAAGDNTPRVFIEADSAYGTVLEIESPDGGTDFIVARNTAGDRLFTVDGEGNLSAQSKSFDIDHPTKEGKRLHYGSLEGPEHGVYVRGRLNGNDTIELPDYWLGLVDENTITVQVTPVGSSQPLYVKDIRDNKVIIGNGSVLTNTPINCFYFVQAERKDVPKIQVEY